MARALEIAIVGDASQLTRELGKAEGKMRTLRRAAGVAGLAIVGGLAVGLRKSVVVDVEHLARTRYPGLAVRPQRRGDRMASTLTSSW